MPSTPDSRAGWASYARALTIRDHAFIDGAFQPAADADTFPSINPADGTVIAMLPPAGPTTSTSPSRRHVAASRRDRGAARRPLAGSRQRRRPSFSPRAPPRSRSRSPSRKARASRSSTTPAASSCWCQSSGPAPDGTAWGPAPWREPLRVNGQPQAYCQQPRTGNRPWPPDHAPAQPQTRVRRTYIAGSSVFSA